MAETKQNRKKFFCLTTAEKLHLVFNWYEHNVAIRNAKPLAVAGDNWSIVIAIVATRA
jgi:hypothetical protein